MNEDATVAEIRKQTKTTIFKANYILETLPMCIYNICVHCVYTTEHIH